MQGAEMFVAPRVGTYMSHVRVVDDDGTVGNAPRAGRELIKAASVGQHPLPEGA